MAELKEESYFSIRNYLNLTIINRYI